MVIDYTKLKNLDLLCCAGPMETNQDLSDIKIDLKEHLFYDGVRKVYAVRPSTVTTESYSETIKVWGFGPFKKTEKIYQTRELSRQPAKYMIYGFKMGDYVALPRTKGGYPYRIELNYLTQLPIIQNRPKNMEDILDLISVDPRLAFDIDVAIIESDKDMEKIIETAKMSVENIIENQYKYGIQVDDEEMAEREAFVKSSKIAINKLMESYNTQKNNSDNENE